MGDRARKIDYEIVVKDLAADILMSWVCEGHSRDWSDKTKDLSADVWDELVKRIEDLTYDLPDGREEVEARAYAALRKESNR